MKHKKVALYTVGVVVTILVSFLVYLKAGLTGVIFSLTIGIVGIALIYGIDTYYQKRVEKAERKIDQFLREEKKEEKRRDG